MTLGGDWEDHARIARKARTSQSTLDAWRAALRPRTEMDGDRNDQARRDALVDAAADDIFGSGGQG